MVAMALMTVLTGTIIFIFAQAQTIYAQVDAKVKVYQYARTALDTMERDLANVVITADMDFFSDGTPRNGHYDPGEELNGGTGIDQTEEKRLKLGMPPNNYHYGFTLRSPTYYPGTDGKKHARDSIYFKTITQYQGQTTAALVEYAMVDSTRERPKLQKRIWYVTGIDQVTNRVQINGSPSATIPIEQDLCLYVTDVSFQIYVKNNRRGQDPADKFTPGTFYSAQDLIDGKMDPVTGVPPFAAMRNYWDGGKNQPAGNGNYMVMCFYDPTHDPGGTDMGRFDKRDNGLFHTGTDFEFPMLGPGDKVYLWAFPNAAGIQPNDYTIKGFRDVGGVKRMEFMERISTTSPQFPDPCEVPYRAAWAPPAVRVKLKIKDEKAKEIRTISRTFKVLASN
jgi:hypothetical protein